MRAMAWIACIAILGMGAAHAQVAKVEAVQYPAWLERGGRAVPLAPGTALQSRDRLVTGGNARVRIRMAEGSAVKLGENATFAIERAEDAGLFRATLAVLAGAFRFTTDKLAGRKDRDVAIRVRNATVGIRGTDVWGKATDARDFVILLEGRVSIATDGHPPITLDQPLDLYQRVPGQAPEAARIDRKAADDYSLETELSAEGAAAEAGGRWRVVAAVLPTRDAARALARQLRARGFPAQVGAKDPYFTAFIPGLASEAAARAAMAAVRGVPGVLLPQVMESP